MYNSMRKTAIVTGGDCKLLDPAGVFFTSMRNNSPILYESAIKYYCVYGDTEMYSNEIKAMKKMGIIIKNINRMADGMPIVGHFTRGLIAKFVPFLYQQHKLFDVSMWFDVDQIMIKEIQHHEIEANEEDVLFIKGGAKVINQFNNADIKSLEEYKDINFELEGICGSFYAVRNCPANSFEYLKKLYINLGDILYLGEQGVIDIFIQRNYEHQSAVCLKGDMFTPHPNNWNVERLERTPENEKPFILHSYGAEKFWNMRQKHSLWEEYNREWQETKKGNGQLRQNSRRGWL